MKPALRPVSWVDQAACRDLPTVLFFGPAGERPEQRWRREVEAKAVCATCPVIVACREYGRAAKANGVFGGETEAERAGAGFPPERSNHEDVHRARGWKGRRPFPAPTTFS